MLSYLANFDDHLSVLRVLRYQTVRTLFAAGTATLIGFIIGPWLIRQLRRLKFGQHYDDDRTGDLAARFDKKNTPTMGGLLIFVCVFVSSLLWAAPNIWVLVSLFVYTGLTAVGFRDDYLKVVKKNRNGISSREKMFWQTLVTILALTALVMHPLSSEKIRELWVPFVKYPVIVFAGSFGLLALFALIFFWLVGFSNAINLTDGLDGLAIGCTITVALVYGAMAYAAGNFKIAEYLLISFVPGTGELAIICGALVGAGMAFLWYNSYPAELFMGDTGSLAIGGLIGVIAFMVQQPFTLIIVGGVFVWEATSVIIQVGYFKVTRRRFGEGRRFFPDGADSPSFSEAGLARDQSGSALLGALAHVRVGRTGHVKTPLNMPVSIPNFLVPLLAEPVAVFGAGCSGRGAGALLQKLGARVVFFDEKRVGLGIVNNFDAVSARQHPLVVYSPGFAPDHPWFSVARAAGCECLSELDLAALHWRGKILAVTGTNGKTTLTEFLTHALTTRGVEARATGNIGYSFSQLVHDTDGGGGTEMMAVCEVSSFQAEGLRHFRADSTIWTNFAEDHLERHGSMAKYFAAKSNLLARTRNATIFVGESVQRFAKQMHRPLAENAVVFSEVKSPDHALNVSVFAHQPQHENYLLAAAWWEHAGYPAHELFSAARSFRLGRHRLNRVGEIAGVTWWNDSKATNFHAVEAALASFASPVMVILGGKGKGGDLGAFVKRIAPHVKRAFLLGETKAALAAFCAAYQVPYVVCSTLDETVTRAAKSARPSDQVLLSPGFSGFDLFRSYDDRGNQFENLVNNLGATATLG